MGGLSTRVLDKIRRSSGASNHEIPVSDQESFLLTLPLKLTKLIHTLLDEHPKALAMMVGSCRAMRALSVTFDLHAMPFSHCNYFQSFAHSRHQFARVGLRVARQVPKPSDVLPACDCSNSDCRMMRQHLFQAPFLGSLQLYECQDLVRTTVLCQCRWLSEIGIRSCDRLLAASITGCTTLKILDISYCSKLQRIEPLTDCSSLHTIKLRFLDKLEDISGIAACPALKVVHLSSCGALKDFSPLATCPSLDILNLNECAGLQEVCFTSASRVQLSAVPVCLNGYLRVHCSSVTVVSCFNLSKLAALPGADLKHLCINECAVEDIRAIRLCTRLQTFDLTGCLKIHPTDVCALQDCTSLYSLTLKACDWVTDDTLLALLECNSLQDLNLSYCCGLSSVVLIPACTTLITLNLSYCAVLEDISALAGCSELQRLDLNGCSALKDISILLWCPKLSFVDVRNCERILDVSLNIANHKCEYKQR